MIVRRSNAPVVETDGTVVEWLARDAPALVHRRLHVEPRDIV